MLPVLRKEGAVHAGSHISGDHGCLNRKGSASAERIYKDPVFIPWGKHNKADASVSVIGAFTVI